LPTKSVSQSKIAALKTDSDSDCGIDTDSYAEGENKGRASSRRHQQRSSPSVTSKPLPPGRLRSSPRVPWEKVFSADIFRRLDAMRARREPLQKITPRALFAVQAFPPQKTSDFNHSDICLENKTLSQHHDKQFE
jgi:hypothetical protein